MPKMGAGHLPLLYIPDGASRYAKLPALTTAQRDALTAVTGMVLYNSTTAQVESYNGSSWVAVGKLYGDATFLPLAGGALTGDVTMTALKTIDGMDPGVHLADYGLHTKVVRKTADETVNNSVTLQNDDELLLAMAANEIWEFRLYLIVDSSAVADFKIGWAVPAGCTLKWAANQFDTTLNNVVRMAQVESETQGIGSPGVTRHDLIAVVHGLAINGANAGNLQLQWAQNTAEASNTVLKANSCLIGTKLA